LLDECDLKAIISLPQGVFVSKGGQGPKTSILCFVKGGRTRNVWFYKVTNDGYTLGTNRNAVPGCQFVEALDLFHRYVREGKQPPETRHSFCIPADWIKVLGPRVKDKIRDETRREMSARAAEDKTKLAEKLDLQVAAKKLTATERKDRLAQHDELWRSKIENAIAQKIERAHPYSFNLSNYCSSLTPTQLAAWKDFAATYLREDDSSKTLEKQYRAIAAAAPDELDELISGLDPHHTLELDIARQFLTGISSELFTKHPHLRTLQEIIASQQKTPRVQLKELLEPVSRPVVFEEGRTYRRITVKLYGKGVLLRDRVTVDDMKGDKWFHVKEGDLIFSKIDARNGAFGLIPEELDDGIVTNEFPTFAMKESDCPRTLLATLLTSKQFYGQIEAKVSGASGRRRFEPENLLEMELPLPLADVREEIATKLESSARIIEGAEAIVSEWRPNEVLFFGGKQTLLGEVANITRGKFTQRPRNDPTYYDGNHPFIQINDITATRKVITQFSQTLNEKGLAVSKEFPKGTLVLSIASSIGQVGILGFDSCFPDSLVAITPKDETVISTEYLFWFLKTFQTQVAAMSDVALQANINVEKLESFPIQIHSPHRAAEIVSTLNAKLAAVEAVERLKADAETTIAEALNRIWES
jgi:type I restriction enzyme M protein